jgi:hypothetical protein
MITPELQAALDRVFDQSNTEGYLAAVTDLNAELDKQAQKYNAIQTALDKYGIEFSQAGKSFQQAKLNERAIQLVKDFDNVSAGVDDINVGLRAMGPTVRAFIADAQKAGAEVPESMRRIIQSSIDAVEVFDANGQKITNIDQLGLKFGTTMQQAMKTVETSISRLNVILEGLAKFLGITLPKAAQTGADGVNDALGDIEDPEINVRVNVPDIPRGGYQDYYQNPEDLPGYGVPEFASGSGGIRDFGAGTMAVLHGREAVVTEADMKSGMAGRSFGGGSPVTVNVAVHVDGVFSEGDLVQTIQRRFEPIIRNIWEDNVGGARTNVQDILGVP